ncbi:hypothetical protein HYG81_14980 [Natrinema zhouii]|uniref:Uncharacterized protein n=1 Tax=Natrinema zhouii TaxID=1710539 RepID=A0A7D6CMW9_9EURY|nr:hypothetical protein [Natrinema zhouii]QLK25377.1 hypothetical protein HYG81_14980 [Natrinema zhouii]
MSAEEFRTTLDTALSSAIAGDADLGEVDQALEDARGRIDEIRTARGEA